MARSWLEASRHGMGRPSGLSRSSGWLELGACSRPSSTSNVCCRAFQCNRNPPPPRPELCGSTTASTVCAATRASTASPPCFNISREASVASGWAVTTTAKPAAEEIARWLLSAPSGSSRLTGAAPTSSAPTSSGQLRSVQRISSRTRARIKEGAKASRVDNPGVPVDPTAGPGWEGRGQWVSSRPRALPVLPGGFREPLPC